MRFFLLYFPQLIEAGKIYRTLPPLFGIPDGKNKTRYFIDRLDIVKYTQKEFVKKHLIKCKKKELSPKDLSILFAKNIDYTYEVNRIADTFAVDPNLLEAILVNHINKKSPKALQKEIKNTYRFMDTKIDKNGIIIEGTIGELYNTVAVNDQLIGECKNIIDIIKDNDELYYDLDGKEVSLFTLMNIFENSSPNGIQRYKGLGEMNYVKLKDSALDPNGQRVLVQYTLDDVKETIESIREYESNMKLILKDVGVVTRTELLG